MTAVAVGDGGELGVGLGEGVDVGDGSGVAGAAVGVAPRIGDGAAVGEAAGAVAVGLSAMEDGEHAATNNAVMTIAIREGTLPADLHI